MYYFSNTHYFREMFLIGKKYRLRMPKHPKPIWLKVISIGRILLAGDLLVAVYSLVAEFLLDMEKLVATYSKFAHP